MSEVPAEASAEGSTTNVVTSLLTGINGSASVFELELIITELYLLKLNFPVGLATNRDVVELSIKRTLINTTEDGFAAILLGRSNAE